MFLVRQIKRKEIQSFRKYKADPKKCFVSVQRVTKKNHTDNREKIFFGPFHDLSLVMKLPNTTYRYFNN